MDRRKYYSFHLIYSRPTIFYSFWFVIMMKMPNHPCSGVVLNATWFKGFLNHDVAIWMLQIDAALSKNINLLRTYLWRTGFRSTHRYMCRYIPHPCWYTCLDHCRENLEFDTRQHLNQKILFHVTSVTVDVIICVYVTIMLYQHGNRRQTRYYM